MSQTSLDTAGAVVLAFIITIVMGMLFWSLMATGSLLGFIIAVAAAVGYLYVHTLPKVKVWWHVRKFRKELD